MLRKDRPERTPWTWLHKSGGRPVGSAAHQTVDRQHEFLRKEKLPNTASSTVQGMRTTRCCKRFTGIVAARYLITKLHKPLADTRGITAACFGTVAKGVAISVNTVLVGVRPWLHALGVMCAQLTGWNIGKLILNNFEWAKHHRRSG